MPLLGCLEADAQGIGDDGQVGAVVKGAKHLGRGGATTEADGVFPFWDQFGRGCRDT